MTINDEELREKIAMLATRGYELLKSNNLGDARECFLEILEYEAENLLALNSMGFIYFFHGEYSKGEEVCRRVIALHPENAYAHKGLGLHLARLGRISEAMRSLKKSISLKEDFVDAYHDLALVMFENGYCNEALALLARGSRQAHSEEEKRMLDRLRQAIEKQSESAE